LHLCNQFFYNEIQFSTDRKLLMQVKYIKYIFLFLFMIAGSLAHATVKNKKKPSGKHATAAHSSEKMVVAQKSDKGRYPSIFGLGTELMTPFKKMDAAFTSNANSLQDVMSVLENAIGKRYVRGAAGPSVFDCSGLMDFAFSILGVSLPHSAAAISRLGQFIAVDELQPGDLLFFEGSKRKRQVGHVGCVYRVDSGKIYMIHSDETGVNICDFNSSKYYKNRFLGAKRVVNFDTLNANNGIF
jgi:cell wall-associated NlpC family hydrolase